MSTALIVLAAGQGTRMNSDLPKVLHPLAGAPLVAHAIRSGAGLEPARIVVVTGHGGDQVEAALKTWAPEAETTRQSEQLGTGHAVLQAKEALTGFEGDAVVLYGDSPFIGEGTFASMAEARANGADLVVLGFRPKDPARYGRLIVEDSQLARIVEFKDANDAERAVDLCNSGVMMMRAGAMFEHLGQVNNDNAAGEYYLTDIVALARAAGQTVRVVEGSEAEMQGIDTRVALARAEAQFQAAARAQALEDGVGLVSPETVIFSHDTVLGRDAIIEQNVVFGPGVTVESGAHIRAFSHIEGAHVSSGAIVGPFARLRPGAELGGDVRVGNFVEIKNATLDEGAKVNHLSYVGDAHVGAAANLGAGTVTCNYDGVMKHRTEIGEDAFIGSDTMLVAPVTVGAKAMTASGSVVTDDVPDGALALGRSKQVNKPGLAVKLMDRLRAIKAKKTKG